MVPFSPTAKISDEELPQIALSVLPWGRGFCHFQADAVSITGFAVEAGKLDLGMEAEVMDVEITGVVFGVIVEEIDVDAGFVDNILVGEQPEEINKRLIIKIQIIFFI